MKIHTLDLNYRQVAQSIASYLVLAEDGPLLVECGPSSTLPTLIERLAAYGLTPSSIRHVLVTHIHLDHAGCLGWWANQGATVYVHDFGAPHIIDPTRLLKSARRIYGDLLEPLFGPVVPAPSDRVIAVAAGDVLSINGLRITAHETPGHARHHHVYEVEGVAFTGDAAGVRLPNHAHLDIPAVPPEFDLEAWLTTLDNLKSLNFTTLYPTHFGILTDVAEHLELFREHLRKTAEFMQAERARGSTRDEILSHYQEWNRQRAVDRGFPANTVDAYESVNPQSMSVDGILRYLEKHPG